MTTVNDLQPQVEHDAAKHRFVIELSPENAHMDYVLLPHHQIDFTHTYVPFRQRGKGYAEALVNAGLDWARQQGFEIKASCWYVDKFLK